MEYVPVLIPTLCRYEHFRRCVESLSECTGAENTEVYIALDFPAKEAHEEGYRQISRYLDNSGIGMKFKAFHVIKRDQNYGISTGGNLYQARVDLFKHYDKLICSEDDNVFSPNFLMYMNWGLIHYQNDDNVCAVCGHTNSGFPICRADKVFLASTYSAWGTGLWRDKWNYISQNVLTVEYAKKQLANISSLSLLWKKSPDLISKLSMIRRTNTVWGDILVESFLLLNHKYVLMPCVNMVRNMGHDGTGAFCQKEENDIYVVQELDESSCFEFPNRVDILDKEFHEKNKCRLKALGRLLYDGIR